jgi:cation transport regulator
MPYKSTKDLPQQVKQLPVSAKRIFLKAFDNSFKKYGEEESFKIAWAAVKRIYAKKGETWVKKSSVKVKSVLGRSGLFGNRYYFDAVISSNQEAEDGLIATDELLEGLYTNNLVEQYGDVDHLGLEGNGSTSGMFKLIENKYQSGKMYGRFLVNKSHPKYNWFINNYKKNDIELSAEFKGYETEGNKIVKCDSLGWTVLMNQNPADRLARAI